MIKIYHYAIAMSAVLALPTTATAQDRVRLSELTEADRTYINRGHNWPEAVCLNAIISEIEAYGGPEAMIEFTINLDDGRPTTIESSVSTYKHSCTNGQHILQDNSGSTILQIYDEDGQPTMQEM